MGLRGGCLSRKEGSANPEAVSPTKVLAEPGAGADALQRPLRFRFQARLSRSVWCQRLKEG
jgi:hypothetical protein